MPSSARTRATVAAKPGRLVGGHPGHRLVEQQQGRLGAQGPGQLHPLAHPVGQRGHRPVQHTAQLEQVGDLGHPPLLFGLLPPRRRECRSPAVRKPARVSRCRPSSRFCATVADADRARF